MDKQMEKQSFQRFVQAAGFLSPSVKQILLQLPVYCQEEAQEIRLRIHQPLCIFTGMKNYFITKSSKLSLQPTEDCYMVTGEDISSSFRGLCSYSIHTHQHEIAQGYISVEGGHRAGICGTAVTINGEITGIRNVSSINLRIAREIIGAGDEVVAKAFQGGICGLLLAGSPSSGKTTILRDLARQLSSGINGIPYKVTVVDERCEIGATYGGVPQNNLGVSCDLLDQFSKAKGILQAVRTLSPQVILCDEIGTEEEIKAVQTGLNCGVVVITTIHAGSMEELLHKPQSKALLNSGAFEKIVFLHGSEQPGKIKNIVQVVTDNASTSGMCHDVSQLCGSRVSPL